jgi:hypothetical protein
MLSSSITLASDAARQMLVLSDISGPVFYPGFEDYLTGYPLMGTDYFVLAKTWYAQEMQRPGCVWTHSLLIPKSALSMVFAVQLLPLFRRPQILELEAPGTPLAAFDLYPQDSMLAPYWIDDAVSYGLIEALFGHAQPVVAVVDSSKVFETTFLALWDGLWPSAKFQLSFCTGALVPRSIGGSLFTLQAVPRAMPPSLLRKNAASAILLEPKAASSSAPWVKYIHQGLFYDNSNQFRSWMEEVAGLEFDRVNLPSLAPIFDKWYALDFSEEEILVAVFGQSGLDSVVQARLVGFLLRSNSSRIDRHFSKRKILQSLASMKDAAGVDFSAILEVEAKRLFEASRPEGCALIQHLLDADLTSHGESLLRSAVRLLSPEDLELFINGQSAFLPTIVGMNTSLAFSPVLWHSVGKRSIEILSQLRGANLTDEERLGIIDAVVSLGNEAPTEALIRFGGSIAISRLLTALANDQIQVSTNLRATLSGNPGVILEWLEHCHNISPRELELGSRYLNPKFNFEKLAEVWERGIASGNNLSSRVAAFGLALALGCGSFKRPLLTASFFKTYSSAAGLNLEYEEWEWLRDLAPAISWWRDWDKCERLAAALARVLEKYRAPLEDFLNIAIDPQVIRRIASVIRDNRSSKAYFTSLRSAAEATSIGTFEQRAAIFRA